MELGRSVEHQTILSRLVGGQEPTSATGEVTLEAFMVGLGLNPDDFDDINYIGTLLNSAWIYRDRQAKYGKNWKDHGWMDCFVLFRTKFTRLQRMWWSGQVAPEDRDLDDAFDAINYLAFFIVNAIAGNERGRST